MGGHVIAVFHLAVGVLDLLNFLAAVKNSMHVGLWTIAVPAGVTHILPGTKVTSRMACDVHITLI